ncbi:PREDICTED: auxin-induced protein X15-like [Nelumbo nucifera]|uniref:Auxin-induced protein 15A-like n=2 Tax=Nelumbo nucifera TaxID=4432 RepID=A0A822Y9B5_NELNU|nr:PREDICTED: auxin-induced protein X15-like [Nelumbo nucifera]DAD28862.1 TPA_asm: hypothetical protein HUJ06_030330 [Nelumbo nucifera]
MLAKRMESVKKLAKKVKAIRCGRQPPQYECLLSDSEESIPKAITPVGFLAIYVGEDRQRFVVPTGFLSHPLFKMLLEKAYDEFGFEQKSGLVVPCTVSTFQEVINVVECCHGQFDLGNLVEEFI